MQYNNKHQPRAEPGSWSLSWPYLRWLTVTSGRLAAAPSTSALS